jgi:TetR/AcrR family transcriptional regulator, cholesterol catabolism regulator
VRRSDGADVGKQRETDGCSRRERRRAETRERLYEAAMQLLTERDFEQVTVEMITDAADVGKGTFFNYFENKEAVVGYRFEKQFRLLTETLQAELSEEDWLSCPLHPGATHPVGGPIWQRMVAITHLVVDTDAQCKRLARILLALSLTNDHIREASQSCQGRVVEVLAELVRAGQASGEFRADVGTRLLVEYLTDAYLTILIRWAKSDDAEDLHQVVERIFALVWSGLRP